MPRTSFLAIFSLIEKGLTPHLKARVICKSAELQLFLCLSHFNTAWYLGTVDRTPLVAGS